MGAIVLMAGIAVQVWASGYVAGAARYEREVVFTMLFLAVLLVGAALTGGGYWEMFGRGHGFFTANRMSALAGFVVVFCAGWWLGARRDRRVR